MRDALFTKLREEGYSGALEDMLIEKLAGTRCLRDDSYVALAEHTGALEDRALAYLTNNGVTSGSLEDRFFSLYTEYGPNLISENVFANWTADNPDSPWSIYSPPEAEGASEVTQGSNGGARFLSDATGGTIGLQQYSADFGVGKSYLVGLELKDVTAGTLYVQFGASNRLEFSAVGFNSGIITSAAAVNFQMYVLSNSDLEVDNIFVREIL